MKNVKIGLVALVAVAFLASSASAATWTTMGGIQYTNYNGHWYGITDQGTWDVAQAQAVGAGGNLVTVDDAAENTFLYDTFVAATPPDWQSPQYVPERMLWIGFTDAAVEGTWVWADGTPVGYTNWDTDEPSNGGGVENYGAIWRTGAWNDYEATYLAPRYGVIQGIIELDPACIPAPGAILIAGIGTACVGYLRRRRAV